MRLLCFHAYVLLYNCLFPYVRDGNNLVTTVTAILKTLIPQGKSINQPPKTLWNKGFNFAVYKSYIKPMTTSKIFVCSYMLLVYHSFCYIFL